MHKRRITTTLLPLSMAVAAQASDSVYTLDDIVVTATRTAQTVDQALAPVSVITREDIKRSQATGITGLLATQPGLQISTNGGPGASASLQIRGTSSSQVLVLVNGQRVGSATLGTAPVQYFDPDQIERIEIVRGPRASLYGADAVGGVMNIITRSGSGTQQTALKAGYGSRNTRTASANLSVSSGSTRYHTGISRYITDGYNRTTSKIGQKADDDFYYNTTASVNVDHAFSERLSAGLNLLRSEGVSEYDSGPNHAPRTNFTNQALSGHTKINLTENWLTALTLSHTVNDSVVTRSSSNSKNKTTRELLNWQNDVSVTDRTLLTVGADYYQDKYDGTSDFDKDSRVNKAIFAQTQTSFSDSDLQLAVRRDDNEAYGINTTGSVAWGFNLPADMRLIASYGTAFRAPTFNDLYSEFGGNPDLEPEESSNKELELRGHHPFGSWSVSAYQNNIEDMIIWKPVDTAGFFWEATQVDHARIRGVDFQSTFNINGWRIKGTLTLLDPEDRKTGKRLEYRARQTASVDIFKSYGAFGFGGTARVQSDVSYIAGSRPDEVYVTERKSLPGFATIDLRGEWQATRELKAGLRVVNLFDKTYSTKRGYIDEPRGIFATLTWSPEL